MFSVSSKNNIEKTAEFRHLYTNYRNFETTTISKTFRTQQEPIIIVQATMSCLPLRGIYPELKKQPETTHCWLTGTQTSLSTNIASCLDPRANATHSAKSQTGLG